MTQEENINTAYDKLLNLADNTDTNSKVVDIKDAIQQLSTEHDLDNIPESYTESNDMPLTTLPFNENGDIVLTAYDPITGEQTVADTYDESSIKDKSSKQFDAFINGADVSLEDIANSKELQEIQDSAKIAILMKRRMNGETFAFYDELPESFKAEVLKIISSNATTNGKPLSKNYVARLFLDDMIDTYKKENQDDLLFDLDTMISGFDKEIEDAQNELSSELGKMMIDLDEDRKSRLDSAIKKCEEEGNTEGVEKLTRIKDTLDKAFSLTDFAEFCLTCKIKNYDLKEPERIYGFLNNKYRDHKNTINDISSCPYILDRHLTDIPSHYNTMLCLAFCKYCRNMDPDNIEDHTFIYYFIRNIILLDKINIKGLNYDSIDERAKPFYDQFISNLRVCISNLIKRNTTLQ